jgi:hypothetical protein
MCSECADPAKREAKKLVARLAEESAVAASEREAVRRRQAYEQLTPLNDADMIAYVEGEEARNWSSYRWPDITNRDFVGILKRTSLRRWNVQLGQIPMDKRLRAAKPTTRTQGWAIAETEPVYIEGTRTSPSYRMMLVEDGGVHGCSAERESVGTWSRWFGSEPATLYVSVSPGVPGEPAMARLAATWKPLPQSVQEVLRLDGRPTHHSMPRLASDPSL